MQIREAIQALGLPTIDYDAHYSYGSCSEPSQTLPDMLPPSPHLSRFTSMHGAGEPSFPSTASVPSLENTLHGLLQSPFGLSEFRQDQQRAILTLISGKDLVLLMPTGRGKSLCFQLPAVYASRSKQAMTLVISPLVSLMEDQVNSLVIKGIDAVCLVSAQQQKSSNIQTRIRQGTDLPDILYTSPEMLRLNDSFSKSLDKLHKMKKLAYIVIDEAHCVSTWGVDFRLDVRFPCSLSRHLLGLPFLVQRARNISR